MVKEQVGKLISGPLSKSTNHYKKSANQQLEAAMVDGSRSQLLQASMRAQLDLLQRAEDIIGKTYGVMKRLNELDQLQNDWNGVARNLPRSLAHVAAAMDEKYPAQYRNNTMSSFLHPQAGVLARLARLTGEPYFSPAQDFIKKLSPIGNAWERGNRLRVKNIVVQRIEKAQTWSSEIKDQTEGIVFGRYALS